MPVLANSILLSRKDLKFCCSGYRQIRVSGKQTQTENRTERHAMNDKRCVVHFVLITLLVAFVLPTVGVTVSQNQTANLTIAAFFAGIIVALQRTALNLVGPKGKTTALDYVGFLLYFFGPGLALYLLVGLTVPTLITVQLGLWEAFGLSLLWCLVDSVLIKPLCS